MGKWEKGKGREGRLYLNDLPYLTPSSFQYSLDILDTEPCFLGDAHVG